ncbi:MAG: DVUA0089 family protein [Phycisphaerae bacterium]|nr:DVUA0089 family protein [Phycisphaerae bacterium]
MTASFPSRPGLSSFQISIIATAHLLLLFGCNQPVVVGPSPYADTADQPAAIAPGVPQPLPMTVLIDEPTFQILIDSFTLLNLVHHPIVPGGAFPGGDQQSFNGQVQIHLVGTGTLAGWQRTIIVPLSGTIDSAVRPYGVNTQSFPVDLFMLDGQITGDPDFDLLQIQAGTNWGMPSPGLTTLTRLPGGDWNVDSFFDVTYRIYYVGAPGGALAGQAGTQSRQTHVQMGQPPVSDTWTEQGDAPELLPGQDTQGQGPLNAISGAISFPGDVDLYCIRIDDALNFQATTVGGATFDTQLFLFDPAGTGIVHNDDDPLGGGTRSRITGQFVPGPGIYVLAISAYNRDPLNPAALLIWNNAPFNVERPPDGPGAPGPLAQWLNDTAVNAPYTIQLTGCSFCSGSFPSIPPGNDYWVVDDPLLIQFGGPETPPIPADFFDPGSQPFEGIVYFGGKPLDSNIGDADTVIRRLESLELPSIPSTDTVPIEILSLELSSVDPIVVDGVQWKVELELPPPQPPGSMTVTRGTADGGTFDSVFHVRPLFVFTRADGMGSPLSWDPGIQIPLNSVGPSTWSDTPPPFTYPGGGPGFFPVAPLELVSPGGAHTILEPAVGSGPPMECPPLDLNFDNLHNGMDLEPWVAAFLAGPSHPAFCAVDANANDVADAGDIQITVAVLLHWPSTLVQVGDWVNVDAECDYKHHTLTGDCREPPRANRTRYIVVQAADKDGNPSNCPVMFRLYNCEGVGTDKAVEVESGDNECVVVPENRKLQVWCKRDEDNIPCAISVKDVANCP